MVDARFRLWNRFSYPLPNSPTKVAASINWRWDLIFQTEKQLKEFGDKLSKTNKSNIEKSLEKLKEAHKNQSLEEIDKCIESLNKSWEAASQEMYKASQEQQQQGQQQEQGNPKSGSAKSKSSSSKNKKEDIADVDFEEVKEEKKEDKKKK